MRETKPAFQASDLISIPNAMTIAGCFLSCNGAKDLSKPANIAKIAVGRGIDVMDGVVARKFNQESNFGAFLDASSDKISTLRVVSEAYKQKAVPKSIIASTAIRQSVNAVATVNTMILRPGEPIRPTKTGKIGMALENLGVISLLGSHSLENRNKKASNLLNIAGKTAIMLSIPLSWHATYQYVKRQKREK